MIPIICIVGPTGVGKTKCSIEIAKVFHGEIISGDSMQFYRGLDIGTAKIKEHETLGIKHHLIDILDPRDAFSVSDYQKLVRREIDLLIEKNITPILVGGSGLYLQSVLFRYDFDGIKRTDSTKTMYENESSEYLFSLLKSQNPDLALKVHPNNRRRILRSLEIASNVNEHTFEVGKELYYPSLILIGLEMERSALYQRLDARVDQMIEEGLLDEVKSLYQDNIKGQSVMAIGYKELYAYLDGHISLEEAIEQIKLHTRRYSKRQMTWFKNKMNAQWFSVDKTQIDTTINQVVQEIKKRVQNTI